MAGLTNWTRSGVIATLTIDNPPVNAISQAVRAALVEGIARANADADVAALVIACAGRTFFAGADLKEFGKPSTQPLLTEVVDTIEASAKPVVAAIHGTALGGGMEIAMACHYRIATQDAKLGLPEVKLGLMPGARGTQHLPRLVGVERALDIIALGDPVKAPDALAMGLVDRIADGDLGSAAIRFAGEMAEKPPRRTRDLAAQKVDDGVYVEFAKRNARKFRGLDAPPAIIASVRAATELPFAEGATREREIFLKLRAGPQTEALRYVFFAEREAAKVPVIAGIDPRPVERAGVIGSGTMGSGIAIALISAGLPVHLFERDPAALARGQAHIAKVLDSNVASGRMTSAKADAARALLSCGTTIDALADADLIIEAAYETMAVKQEIFASLDRIARSGAILASNTSYLDLDEIAAATSRPADVVGMHFFSPANIMKLLEIVQGAETSPDVLATAFALAKRLGKVAVLSGNAWGFIGNRMLAVRRKHAEAMVVEGAAPEQVDGVMEAFGMAMGPIRVGDLAGLDLGWSPETSTGSTIRERLCEAGRRGQKTQAGFYDYGEDSKPVPSEEARRIIAEFARDNGVVRREFSDAEVLDRLLWPMVDEGAQLLEDGIALRESDIDVVWLNGYGWPAWTGGPMYHARHVGLSEVVRRLEEMGIGASPALFALARGEPK
ncbi:3-hydroxyacyl-CoA dehydrogenase NAD-binding domain-containing protein [Alteraurantiacibacter buctensis]|uniref:3-hydroxyacyl-CoA dehydrogenase n=1 Tax=Alteraurantiacibacter buctensis TaxID=1503981 RepID=A0A844Z1Y8_9SPHN|nr:3-hydroxyacyl-CoA dehydrogenase NAD-binding domain-containing protein [Alteraurantiacibacter buctensis]MXO73001.1 3-hydroxyacyl-CoA dehydrogenase [Alteraurantiacibacter buctensis]